MARSDQIPANKIFLSVEQERYLISNYATTINHDLCQELNICERTLRRLAIEKGLVKDMGALEGQRRKRISEALHRSPRMKARVVNPENGIKTRFKPGFKPLEAFGEEKFLDAHKKAVETRKKRFVEERARVTFGLPQKTNMRVIHQPRQKIMDRSYLKRRGYIIDDRENIAYWTDKTKRATRMEARPKRFYTFKQYDMSHVQEQ